MKAPEIFSPTSLRIFTQEILDRIGDIPGVTVKKQGGKYDDKEFTMKIKFTLENSNLKSQAQEHYESAIQPIYNLPEWGFTFKDRNGEEFTMIDYKPRSPKYPIIAMNKAGIWYKFSINNIKHYLGI